MPKRRPNKRYTGEFKQMVVETMMREKISCKEAARRFEVRSDTQVASWERIYLTEGPEMLYVERRGRGRKGHPSKLPKEVEDDLLKEVPRLKGVSFETAIIERYRRRESSVEEALIEMYLAGVSVRRIEDITEAFGAAGSPL